jgi:hypothetical protein
MKHNVRDRLNVITIGICGAVMVVLGSWLPPMIEAPRPPRIKTLFEMEC